ncbi:hypothetical protein ZWY2020_026425 [Hordeum vulgare]|nr:hypothetical protein ZWY2020_026425 [Hordeum vulgare]
MGADAATCRPLANTRLTLPTRHGGSPFGSLSMRASDSSPQPPTPPSSPATSAPVPPLAHVGRNERPSRYADASLTTQARRTPDVDVRCKIYVKEHITYHAAAPATTLIIRSTCKTAINFTAEDDKKSKVSCSPYLLDGSQGSDSASEINKSVAAITRDHERTEPLRWGAGRGGGATRRERPWKCGQRVRVAEAP